MPKFIDDFLDRTTMYRLVLYILCLFFVSALVLSFFKFLSYTPFDLTASLFIILLVSYISNALFAWAYEAPTNVESIYITALILFFIVTPVQGGAYAQFLSLAFWASVWAVASKYIFAIGRKHIFNPAAIALVIVAFTINQSGSWWIGTPVMLPFVLFGGLLMARKALRIDLVLSFMISALTTIAVLAMLKGADAPSIINTSILTLKNSAIFFFAIIMLTEPLTGPKTKWPRILFGVLVGFLFAPALHIGSFYSTPELALVIGNIFAYIVSPKEKLFLKLKERIQVGTDTFDFVFQKDKQFNFQPGQYMEWTLKHSKPDSRGNRRYFTLASSPTEPKIRLGVKFYPKENKQSSFKKRLMALPIGEKLVAAERSGDFVLPKDKDQELVFIAGGIGITPFRSMIQYLLDKREPRNITLLYSNKKVSDIAYREVFEQAEKQLGIKTVYAITDKDEITTDNSMYNGFIDAQVIQKEVPDYMHKTFYISGPHGMVRAFENTLRSMGIPKRNIKIDFFPGFA